MNSKIRLWFLLGLSAFSLSLGLLIGVSQSPVVGVFITGLMGLSAGVAGILFRRKEGNLKTSGDTDFNLIGKGLFFSSFFLILGVFTGSEYRARIFEADPAEFIWTDENKPKTTHEALDWIMVKELLIKKGFTESQVKQIYELRILELKNGQKDTYDRTKPYFKMLIEEFESAGEPKKEKPAPTF